MTGKALSLRAATTPNSADTPDNEHLWRSLTQAKRDLQEVNHTRQREIAIWLWRRNGIAKRYGEIIRTFTAGDEPTVQSEDEALQAVLDDFWDDPVNRLREFGPQIAEQRHILGEQFITAHVRDSDGRLQLGYLDPDIVEAVVPMPGNDRDLVEVHVKRGVTARDVYRIVRPGEKLGEIFAGINGDGKRSQGAFRLLPRPPEILAAEKGDVYGRARRKTYTGAVFLTRRNVLSNSTRGTSDLLPRPTTSTGSTRPHSTPWNAVSS